MAKVIDVDEAVVHDDPYVPPFPVGEMVVTGVVAVVVIAVIVTLYAVFGGTVAAAVDSWLAG